MRKRQKSIGINKQDVADFRKAIGMQREYDAIISRLSEKLNCDFFDLGGNAERLRDLGPDVSDEDLCFEIGRLAMDRD